VIYASYPLIRARRLEHFFRRPVRSDVSVIASIGLQYLAQKRLTQDDDMIQTLATDSSNQPFSKPILPRRGWCYRVVPDAHGAQSACDDGAIDAIPINGPPAEEPCPIPPAPERTVGPPIS
jgi:hypothetical protein